MRIALCSYSQKEKETALLMKLGKVDRFDNGVFCVYAMQRDGPYDAVVVMEDGARGMNFCMSIRGYSKDVPLLWISDQAEFEPQSRRMQADTFLESPLQSISWGKQSPGFFREKGEVMNQVRRKRMNKKYYRREQNRHAI